MFHHQKSMERFKEKEQVMSAKYNGWSNYETWNVALWILNDEGLYNMAREYRHKVHPYKEFIDAIRDFGGDIAFQTPDKVAWNDSGLDIEALDQMMEEL
jgi:hypothetical protein